MINHRHTIRLQRHNYSSPQAYFVTINAYRHDCIFGDITNQEFTPNQTGKIVTNWYHQIPHRFSNTKPNIFQLMPNHLHFIIQITQPTLNSGRGNRAPTLTTLGQIIAFFKYNSTKEVNCKGAVPAPYQNFHTFQRNYYEHIIRDQTDFIQHQHYIANNPKSWYFDPHNPNRLKNSRLP